MAVVYLSRRNLLTLLAKLDDPDSQCTLIKNDTEHPAFPCSEVVQVTAIEDDDYYTDREAGPVAHETEVVRLRESFGRDEKYLK